ENLASLGMPDQHIRTTRISQLTRGDLAGQCALHRLHRAVLRTHANRLALEPHHHLGDIQRGRNYSNLDSHRQSQLTKTSDQFSYAGAGTVHLPVTSYQWSTHALPRRSKWAQMLPKSFNTGKRIKHIDSLADPFSRTGFGDDPGQRLGVLANLDFVIALDHDTHQWLGAGLAQQDPTAPGHLTGNLITCLLH